MPLPRLSCAIPQSIVPRKLAAANAAIARFLLQAGALREGDIPTSWDDALEVCERALDGWIKRELGPLNCLSPSFSLIALDGSSPYALQSAKQQAQQAALALEYHSVEIVWHESGEEQWIVGPILELLNQQSPGLGRAILAVLQNQSAKVYPVFTPELACDVASIMYWYGEENESSVLDEECGDDAVARKAMLDDMVTTQKLKDAYPSWATSLHRQKTSVAQLRRMADSLTDPFLQEVAADALALSHLRIDNAYQPDVEGEYLGWGAVLSWRQDDLTVRIYDDLVNMAYQGEYCDRIGELEIPLEATATLCEWQKAMRLRFKAISLIDRLIHRLAL